MAVLFPRVDFYYIHNAARTLQNNDNNNNNNFITQLFI